MIDSRNTNEAEAEVTITLTGAQTRTLEFDRQVVTLIGKRYHELAGMSAPDFALQHLEPLREPVLAQELDFVLVAKRDLVAPTDAIERVERRGRSGFSVLEPDDLGRFDPIEDVALPASPVYAVLGVDTGRDTRGLTPDEALVSIRSAGRSPLTIDEGVALVTHHPEAVAKNGGFSLAGSRCGDRRVTALWISDNRPKLGWCWAGNPHTWLGTASCTERVEAS